MSHIYTEPTAEQARFGCKCARSHEWGVDCPKYVLLPVTPDGHPTNLTAAQNWWRTPTGFLCPKCVTHQP